MILQYCEFIRLPLIIFTIRIVLIQSENQTADSKNSHGLEKIDTNTLNVEKAQPDTKGTEHYAAEEISLLVSDMSDDAKSVFNDVGQQGNENHETESLPQHNLTDSDASQGSTFGQESLSLRKILISLLPHQLSEETVSQSKPEEEEEHILHEDLDQREEDVLASSGFEVAPDSAQVQRNTTDGLLNVTNENTAKASNSSQTKKAVCLPLESPPEKIGDVEIINGTTLQNILRSTPNITNRSTPANCYVVYFFSPYCPFSTQGSAYVNALARSLPNIPVFGLDSIEHHSLNARYGIMGTPSLVLFHNGNVAGRYNASEFATFYLESFVNHFTDQKISSINVTSHDFKANLPSQTLPSTPYALYVAWSFLLICGSCLFLNSVFYAKLTEAILNNWREAEAQHEHDE